MSAPSAIPPPAPAQWLAPSGTLVIAEDGAISALFHTTLRTEEVVSASVAAIADLQHAPFVAPARPTRDEQGYHLHWPASDGTRRSLVDLAGVWRRDPAAHVAQAIEAALVVSRAVGELQHLAPRQFLLSPAQIFLTAMEARDTWSALPLSIDAAQLSEMTAASPELTVWLSGDNLLRRGGLDRCYMMAACLHYCLIGELYPPELSRMRRLERQFTFRAANAAHLRHVLADAIPQGLETNARRLADFVTEALSPAFARPMTAAQGVATVERLRGELSAPLLAGAWEIAGRIDCALAILEAHARTTPPEDVPWQTLERLRGGRTSDDIDRTPDRAMAARSDTPIGRIRALGEAGPDATPLLAETLTALIRPGGRELGEEERLFVAYAGARWLGKHDLSSALLSRPCVATWNKAVRTLLLARLNSDQQNWAQVARHCRDCITLIESMPGRGSERGTYATACALMLDAAAHIGFVKTGASPDFLEAAWERLERARTLCRSLRVMPLEEAIHVQVAALRMAANTPQSSSLRARIDEDRIQLRNLADNDVGEEPQVLWPDHCWLFSE